MKAFLTGLILLSMSLLSAQNTYHRVVELNTAQKWLRSTAAQVSGPTTSVLIYQHGGASLSTSGDATGEVTSLNGAGHYDLNRVAHVSGDTLFLSLPVKHNYDLTQSQLVLFQSSPAVTVTGAQSVSQAYDGNTGGITFIAAGERISFESGASLDASGAGFRGGQGLEASSDCNRLTVANGLTYEAGNWRGSSRGEGIGGIPTGQPFGRAPAGNGGGGGNDHNAGGGGGGNISKGGVGGRNVVMGLFNNACRGNYPGLGGLGLTDETERLYFGGGGGAGHANNATDSGGGNGGGLIVLWAPTINFGTSSELIANGMDGGDANGDGGGGGGAAGSVLLATDSLMGTPNIFLDGGNGGDVVNSASRCFGPGGGGGGGRLLNTARSRAGYSPDASLIGGGFGKRLSSNECGPDDEPAGTGEDGEDENIPPVIPFGGFVQSADTLCGGEVLRLTDATSGAIRVEWAVVPQSEDLSVDVLGQSLRITTTPIAGGTFRAIQTLFLDDVAYPGDTALFTVFPSAVVASTSIVSSGETITVSLIEATGFDLIRYDFGDGFTVDTNATTLRYDYAFAGNFPILVTLLNDGCGNEVFVDTTFAVGAFASVDTDLKFAEGCAPFTLTITDRSTGTYDDRRWNFPGGNPETSTSVQPSVTYTEAGEYDVTLTLLGAIGSDTIRIIPVSVFAQPVANISVAVDTSSAAFSNNSADGSEFFWDFGDTRTSTEAEPSHNYAATGTYTVTFVTENGPCRDSASLEVVIDVLSDLTGLEELGVRLFPNPTSGRLTLTGPARISGVFDLTGRKVLIADDRFTDLSDLPSATYLVSISAGDRIHWVRVVRR